MNAKPILLALSIPFACLGAIGLGFLALRSDPVFLFGWAFAAVVGAGLVWVLVSALSPTVIDRTCPHCGAAAVERLDPETTQGLACTVCDWRDGSESSFFLAEDDGVPIEPIVLAGRAQKGDRAGEKAAGPIAPVDSGPNVD